MTSRTPGRGLAFVFLGAFAFSAVSGHAEEPVDLSVIHRIKAEALENSKVMEHVFYLTDVNGPRLTNSPGFKSAGDWVVKRLQEYGLTSVHQEPWGPFGRGWTYTHFSGHMLAPAYAPLIGFPLAWSPGTQCPMYSLAGIRAAERTRFGASAKCARAARPRDEIPVPRKRRRANLRTAFRKNTAAPVLVFTRV